MDLCALPAYELPKVGIEGPFTFLMSLLAFRPSDSCRPSSCSRCCAASATPCAGGRKKTIAFAAYA